MKKLILPFIAILFVTGCVKDDTADMLPDPEVKENGSVIFRSPPPKINVCHYDADDNSWHVISINENAWPAHAGHGDVQLIDADGDGWVTAENACGIPVDCDDTDAQVTDNCCTDYSEFTISFEEYFDFETGMVCEFCPPHGGFPYDLIWIYNGLTSIAARMWWVNTSTDMAFVYDRSFCQLTCGNVADYYFCEYIYDPDPACENSDTPPVDFVGIYKTSEGNYWVVEWLSEDEDNHTVTFRYRELCPE